MGAAAPAAMLKRKTLRTLTKLFTQGLAPLLRATQAPRQRKASAKPKPQPKPAGRAKASGLRTQARPAAKPVARAAAAGRWVKGLAISPAGARRYRLFLPPGPRAGTPMPLLLMLHGCDQDAASFAASTRMHQIAAREGFAVLFPEQDRLANVNGCWNWFATRNGQAQAEVSLLMQMVAQACTLYGADRARVAIAGLSAGASMAALVATRHPGRFQAVAMHSGVPPGAARSGMGALAAMSGHAPRRPRPNEALPAATPWPALLVLHGSDDRVVHLRNAHLAVQAWSEAAGAQAQAPRAVQRGSRHPMQVTDHVAAGRNVARLVEIASLGHAWSGGVASQAYGDPRGPDASRLLWAFVREQLRTVV